MYPLVYFDNPLHRSVYVSVKWTDFTISSRTRNSIVYMPISLLIIPQAHLVLVLWVVAFVVLNKLTLDDAEVAWA